jgi:nucleotide-binding universal stress UspA family protein
MVVPHGGAHSDEGPVVVGVDIAEHSVPALGWAFAEAAARRARLVAVHACWWEEPSLLLDVPPREEPAWADIVDAEGQQLSEMLAGWREKYPDVEVEPVVVHEHPATALEGSSTGSQLLVVGSRGRGGFTGLLLGSVSAHAVHHSHCPVVVVPSTVRGPGRPMTGESS